MTFNYLFRKPVFPILCDIDGHVIAAKSEKSLVRQLAELELEPEKHFDAVDSTIEGWALYPAEQILSPLTFRKRWTKIDMISLYNNRKNVAAGDIPYSEKSLSAKKCERVFGEIVELLLESRKTRTKK